MHQFRPTEYGGLKLTEYYINVIIKKCHKWLICIYLYIKLFPNLFFGLHLVLFLLVLQPFVNEGSVLTLHEALWRSRQTKLLARDVGSDKNNGCQTLRFRAPESSCPFSILNNIIRNKRKDRQRQ